MWACRLAWRCGCSMHGLSSAGHTSRDRGVAAARLADLNHPGQASPRAATPRDSQCKVIALRARRAFHHATRRKKLRDSQTQARARPTRTVSVATAAGARAATATPD